jgi:site-specific recombinase XerD
MKLSTGLNQFFVQYLPHIKGSSEKTIQAYRDTYRLFLPFAADYHHIKIASLRIEHLTVELILSFLNHLEEKRKNTTRTRNLRLVAIKSLAKMIRFMYPQYRKLAEQILSIPQKRMQKKLIGYLYSQEVMDVFKVVGLKKNEGFRDYCLLHLLFDSGARATEIATLNLDYFDAHNQTLAILGKGNRFRQIQLWPKTCELITLYIQKYRTNPSPLYRHRLFINQRGQALTRSGIHRLCRKYLQRALAPKRLKSIHPAHSFRHSRAVNMLGCGHAITDIKNRLGHENINSTMVYLHMDLTHKRSVQKKFLQYAQSTLKQDPKLDELIDWDHKEDILAWLDSL